MSALRVGIAHHLGWAVAVTAAPGGEVVDRRRLELVDGGLPPAPNHHHGGAHPMHGDGPPLDDDALAELVARVRASAARMTARALDELASSVASPIVSMSLRAWPAGFPTDVAVLRRERELKSEAGRTRVENGGVPDRKQTARAAGAGPAAPKLLSGGNPQIPKGEGDRPVQAYIAAMPGWKRGLGQRLDELIVRTVPEVHKAVKWNQPFYGNAGDGWFVAFRCYTSYVQLQFFRGTSLDPIPPKGSSHPEVRYFDIHEDDPLDEELLVSWITQAAALPGEKM